MKKIKTLKDIVSGLILPGQKIKSLKDYKYYPYVDKNGNKNNQPKLPAKNNEGIKMDAEYLNGGFRINIKSDFNIKGYICASNGVFNTKNDVKSNNVSDNVILVPFFPGNAEFASHYYQNQMFYLIKEANKSKPPKKIITVCADYQNVGPNAYKSPSGRDLINNGKKMIKFFMEKYELKLDQVHIIGHSLGGGIGLNVASELATEEEKLAIQEKRTPRYPMAKSWKSYSKLRDFVPALASKNNSKIRALLSYAFGLGAKIFKWDINAVKAYKTLNKLNPGGVKAYSSKLGYDSIIKERAQLTHAIDKNAKEAVSIYVKNKASKKVKKESKKLKKELNKNKDKIINLYQDSLNNKEKKIIKTYHKEYCVNGEHSSDFFNKNNSFVEKLMNDIKSQVSNHENSNKKDKDKNYTYIKGPERSESTLGKNKLPPVIKRDKRINSKSLTKINIQIAKKNDSIKKIDKKLKVEKDALESLNVISTSMMSLDIEFETLEKNRKNIKKPKINKIISNTVKHSEQMVAYYVDLKKHYDNSTNIAYNISKKTKQQLSILTKIKQNGCFLDMDGNPDTTKKLSKNDKKNLAKKIAYLYKVSEKTCNLLKYSEINSEHFKKKINQAKKAHIKSFEKAISSRDKELKKANKIIDSKYKKLINNNKQTLKVNIKKIDNRLNKYLKEVQSSYDTKKIEKKIKKLKIELEQYKKITTGNKSVTDKYIKRNENHIKVLEKQKSNLEDIAINLKISKEQSAIEAKKRLTNDTNTTISKLIKKREEFKISNKKYTTEETNDLLDEFQETYPDKYNNYIKKYRKSEAYKARRRLQGLNKDMKKQKQLIKLFETEISKAEPLKKDQYNNIDNNLTKAKTKLNDANKELKKIRDTRKEEKVIIQIAGMKPKTSLLKRIRQRNKNKNSKKKMSKIIKQIVNDDTKIHELKAEFKVNQEELRELTKQIKTIKGGLKPEYKNSDTYKTLNSKLEIVKEHKLGLEEIQTNINQKIKILQIEEKKLKKDGENLNKQIQQDRTDNLIKQSSKSLGKLQSKFEKVAKDMGEGNVERKPTKLKKFATSAYNKAKSITPRKIYKKVKTQVQKRKKKTP